MSLPIFYTPDPGGGILDGTEAFHIAKVLRAKPGARILVTNGKDTCIRAALTDVTTKRVAFTPEEVLPNSVRPYKITLAVAPTRKPERNEWMLEKLVELGIDRVIFMKTTHTHLESFQRVVNPYRMEKVAIAAMKQSGQLTLPDIVIGQELQEVLAGSPDDGRFIAYVPDKTTAPHLAKAASSSKNVMALIGPEGDFTQEEVKISEESGFRLVSLGATRLRTETAAIAACHALHIARLL